jgi:hypothetical protein
MNKLGAAVRLHQMTRSLAPGGGNQRRLKKYICVRSPTQQNGFASDIQRNAGCAHQ